MNNQDLELVHQMADMFVKHHGLSSINVVSQLLQKCQETVNKGEQENLTKMKAELLKEELSKNKE